MSSKHLKNFLKALDTVKQDQTCVVCSQLCKSPGTLSKCFHIICSEHFDDLKTCPKCDISLEGCTIFKDSSLDAGVEATRELDKMFENFREDSGSKSDQRSFRSETHKSELKRKNSEKSLENDTTVHSDPKKSTESNKLKLKSGKENSNASNVSKVSKKTNNLTEQSTIDRNDSITESTVSIDNLRNSLKSIEKRNSKGETMLHVLCRLNKTDKIAELLKEGANTNTKDYAGWTPLHEVVQSGRLDLVKLLLQYKTLINVPGPNNETPLHEAVRYNHKEIAEELVRNGADINIRNSKGETPLQLANNEMKLILEKAARNIIQTESITIEYIAGLYSYIKAYCVSLYRTVHNKIKLLAKHHSNVHIETKFTDKTTHLIIDTEDNGVCTPNLDVLQGIVSQSCIWILSSEWVTKSSEDKLEPFEEYEVKGVGTITSNGPKNARYNKYKQLPGIFNGCHFYFHNFNVKHEISKNIVITKAILTKLVTDAGGIVLRRVPNPESIPDYEKLVPYHAKRDGKLAICSHYIIFKTTYEPMYNMQHLKALPIGWLIECIEKYELCEPW